jgi:hypothetical protein
VSGGGGRRGLTVRKDGNALRSSRMSLLVRKILTPAAGSGKRPYQQVPRHETRHVCQEVSRGGVPAGHERLMDLVGGGEENPKEDHGEVGGAGFEVAGAPGESASEYGKEGEMGHLVHARE